MVGLISGWLSDLAIGCTKGSLSGIDGILPVEVALGSPSRLSISCSFSSESPSVLGNP